MFSLSPAGRQNLEAICVELERAARQHPPLYHQQLKPWSANGEVRITEQQWVAFIENEGNGLSEEVWCDWHGPFDDYLGIWFGSPDGIDEFCDLIESVAMVLRREDFSNIDPLDLRVEFESLHEWLSTLHQWAMKFSLPLLRGFGEVWNGEASDADEYIRLIHSWGGIGAVSYPLHPLVFNLQYNVYSSTLAAIRAILTPEFVTATNEAWPLSDVANSPRYSAGANSSFANVEVDNRGGESHAHRILETTSNWCIIPAGSETIITPKKNAGLQRLAIMIEHPSKEFSPQELYPYGQRRVTTLGRAASRTRSALVEDWRGQMHRSQEQDDPDQRREAEVQYRAIREELDIAKQNGDEAAAIRLNGELAALLESFNIGDDGKVRPQRSFRDPEHKRVQDTVATTIRDTVKELRNNGLSQIANELEQQLDLKRLAFDPKDDQTQWTVVRIQ
ncbi:MAG: hypothetical protein R3C18_27635 [Planctomycetaceae bacterium]